jgi:hypothetical protein
MNSFRLAPAKECSVKNHARPERDERALLRDAAAHAKQERDGRDRLIVDIAEIDARKVFRAAGYPSALTYCVEELGLSTKAALHRIHVARVAWRFPVVLAAMTEGRVGLTAVSMLAAHLDEKNAEELVEEAAGKTKPELRRLIAERFPRRDLFSVLPALSAPSLLDAVPSELPARPRPEESPTVATQVDRAAERRLDGVRHPQPIAALTAPERFPLKIALKPKTHQKLLHARDLLGHQLPSGDIAEVLDRALDLLIAKIEKAKFGATTKPGNPLHRKAANTRHIPAAVRRAVVERDGWQCTFRGPGGKRCPARTMLEFDHILEVARGGSSTVDNVRLRCRAHNQYTAELTYGADFMKAKRQAEQRVAAS